MRQNAQTGVKIEPGRFRKFASGFLGEKTTGRLQTALLPGLRWNQEIYGEVLTRYVNSEVRWLDAGCGRRVLADGLEAIERKLVKSAGFVVGVDVQFGGQTSGEELPVRAAADLDHLPFVDGSFDLISCNMVVEHLRTPANTFRELARVLAPEGHLVIHTPNALSYVVCSGRVAKATLPRNWIFKVILWSERREPEDVFPTFYRANTNGRIKTLLGQAGLRERSSKLLLGPRPIFWRFAPIAILELLLRRLSLLGPFRFLRSALLVVYEKPLEHGKSSIERAETPGIRVRIA